MNANQHLLTNTAAKGKARKPSRTKVLRLEWQEAQAAAGLADIRFTAAVAAAEHSALHMSVPVTDAILTAHQEWTKALAAQAAAKEAFVQHLHTVMAKAADPRRVRDVKP